MTNLSWFHSNMISRLAVFVAAGGISAQTIPVPFIKRVQTEASTSAAGVSSATGKKIARKDLCWLFPLAGTTCGGSTISLKPGTPSDRDNNINTFYSTSGQFSFFHQVRTAYNGASASATVAADLASLNFPSALQLTLGTNVQAGSFGSSVTGTTAVPTLAAAGAGQATQNMISGGTIVASAIYPVIAIKADNINSQAGNFGAVAFLSAREGVDIQNFKAGTSTTATKPPSHTFAGTEGYLQYNSINTKSPTDSTFIGAVFLGGSYGYSYTAHSYARDYGFGDNVSHRLGQISFGVLINGVARITVSRAFGPSQTYIDSMSMAKTTVNNFKAWSFGIAYQQSPSK